MKRALAVLLISLLASCAPGVRGDNNDVIVFADVEPTIQTYIEPTINIADYERFTIGALAGSEYAPKRNPIEEKQLFPTIINQLTRRGYRYDASGRNADFVVYIRGYENRYETVYIPPETVVLPRWVPGQTITSTADANIYYGGQAGYGSATQRTFIPGYMTTDEYTTSGSTTGSYYPITALEFYDATSSTRVYLGSALWLSDVADIRISFPWIANYALQDVPAALNPTPCLQIKNRSLGATTLMGTLNGNDYYPIIAGFSENHPIRYLTRERLHRYDAIVSVNDLPLKNIADSCQQNLIFTQPANQSTVRTLQILRGSELINVLVELY